MKEKPHNASTIEWNHEAVNQMMRRLKKNICVAKNIFALQNFKTNVRVEVSTCQGKKYMLMSRLHFYWMINLHIFFSKSCPLGVETIINDQQDMIASTFMKDFMYIRSMTGWWLKKLLL